MDRRDKSRDDWRGARVALTGRFVRVGRAPVREALRARGGRVVRSVTRTTTHLVVGAGGWPLLPDGSIPHSLRRAEALRRDGGGPRILAEAALLEALGLAAPSARAPAYPLEDAAGLLGVDRDTLRRCEQLGLIRGERGGLDFQDLVSLRTVLELLRSGVRLDAISASVNRLARLVPGLDRPLAQFELIAAGPRRVLARREGTLMAPDGQLVLPFVDTTGQRAHPGPLAKIGRSAEQWRALGESLEASGRYEQAAEAYREALTVHPELAEAAFNLGHVLRTLGEDPAAEQAYRHAAESGAMPEAWYNLGDMLEERGDTAAAIASLEQALILDPAYADAHFNLALCLEHAGEPRRAAHHWRCYLRLDPHSAWGRIAASWLRQVEQAADGKAAPASSHPPSLPR